MGTFSPENVTAGITFEAVSLHRLSGIIFGIDIIFGAIAINYNLDRTLDFLEREDFPHTRLMLNLSSMLLFAFGFLIALHQMLVTSMIGLIAIWLSLTLSIIPMWKATTDETSISRGLHIITNIQFTGGMMAFIAIHNTMKPIYPIWWLL